MKSLIAALRNLVLPFGQSSGQRILLNGDDGVILVYDANNNVIGSIAPRADPGGTYLRGITEYSYNGANPALGGAYISMDSGDINFGQWSGSTAYTRNGFVGQDNIPGTLRLSAPTFDVNHHTAIVDLNSVADDTTNPNVVLYGPSGETVDLYLTGFVYAVTSLLTPDHEVWQTATILNAGVPNGGVPNPPPQYRILPTGHVELRGGLAGGTQANGTHLFQLPAGTGTVRSYRPTSNYRVAAVAQNPTGSTFGTWTVDVQTTGFVSCLGVPSGLTSLHFENVFIPLE